MQSINTRHGRALALGGLLLLLVSGGCREQVAGQETGMSDKQKPPAAVSGQPVPSAPGVPAALMERLVATVRAEHGAAAVDVVRAESATWSDAALGCPQPNMGYAQVIVNGYWVILRANGEEFDFRASDDSHFLRCTGATRQPPIVYPDQDT